MRIVFMGTPDFAVPTLDALAGAGHEIVAAYTQPPRPGGRRGRELVPSPVQRRAEALGVPVRHPVSLKGADEQAAFAALAPDIAVVAAYGLILPRAVLDAPRHGCLNVHGSLLPRWRGAAPIQRAILSGDAETGVCIMGMEAGLDTGPVRLEGRVAVDGRTAGALAEELAALGAALMVRVVGDLDAYPPVAQPDEGVTYAAKIDKAEARIDFARTAADVERLVRAMNPAPGAWFEVAGERVKLWAAEVVNPLPSGERASERSEARERGSETHDACLTAPLPISPSARPPASGEQRPALFRSGRGPDRPDAPQGGEGIVLDDRLTIACGSGAIRPVLVQRAGRGVTSAAELLRGFPIAAGTRL